MNFLDFTILISYVLLVVAVGCGSAYFQKRKAARLNIQQDDGAYFLAARTLPWPIIGLSLFSTNISTVHIVSLCEQGYRSGLAYANFELAAVFTLVILAVVFVPFYLRAHITTLPDFLEKRFNRNCRDFLAFISIVSAIFIHIGTSLYAGGIVINSMLGFGIDMGSLMPTMAMIAVATGLYVVVGGLLAVTLTDSIQTTTLLIGSAIVTYFAFTKLGGWNALHDTVGPHMLSTVRPTGDFSKLPWHAVLIGYPIIGIWYWCTDQTIVQRVLGAKNEDHGKAGALFAGFLKLLPMFVFVLPGLLCLALINNGHLPNLSDSREAFPHMVMSLLPNGMRGLIAAGLLAALMGSIAGALNSIATLFAFDLYKRFRPDTTDKKLVHIGRVATVSAVIMAILFAPMFEKFESLYEAGASMICYVAPPITTVFMIGVFWKRATAKAAAITLWSGFAMGVVVFLLDVLKADYSGWLASTIPSLANFQPFFKDGAWDIVFMHGAGLLCGICILIMITATLLDKNTNTEESLKLVWDSPLTPLKIKGARGLLNYKFLSVVLLLTASAIYFVFRIPSKEKMDAWKTANPENAAKIEQHINPPPAADAEAEASAEAETEE